VFNYHGGLEPTIRSTLMAMRRCKFHRSTATAMSSPPRNSILASCSRQSMQCNVMCKTDVTKGITVCHSYQMDHTHWGLISRMRFIGGKRENFPIFPKLPPRRSVSSFPVFSNHWLNQLQIAPWPYLLGRCRVLIISLGEFSVYRSTRDKMMHLL